MARIFAPDDLRYVGDPYNSDTWTVRPARMILNLLRAYTSFNPHLTYAEKEKFKNG